jgi:thiol-disulfide isomerase/thioredoxin
MSAPTPAQRGLDLEAHAIVEQRAGSVVVRIPALDLAAEGPSVEKAWARLSETLVAALPRDAALRSRLEALARDHSRPVPPPRLVDLTAHEALSAIPPTDRDGLAFLLTGAHPVLVEFWAKWSDPCVDLAPELLAAAATLDGQIEVVRVDVDHEPELVAEFGIQSVPTLLLLSQDGERLRLLGSRPRAQLLGELEPFVRHPAR